MKWHSLWPEKPGRVFHRTGHMFLNIAGAFQKILKKKAFLISIASLASGGFLATGILYTLVLGEILGHLPEKEELRNITQDEASEVYSADNVLMGRYFVKNRVNIALDSVPRYVVNALIATEDVRFYEHNGVDFRSLARVAIKSILMDKEESGGGSTITQQLAKNLYPRKDYGIFSIFVNKAREHIISLRLEEVYTKEEILSLYLNTVSFGEDTYGLETASRRFFNNHPTTLTIEEAALLIGVLKGPTLYNPRINYENAIERRNLVLSQMNKYGYIEENKLDSLINLPLDINYSKYSGHSGLAPYFREFLRMEVGKILKEIETQTGKKYDLFKGGLKIYTTIDSRMQSYAENSVREQIRNLQDLLENHYNGKFPWNNRDKLINFLIRNSGHYKRLAEMGMAQEEIMASFRDTIKVSLFTWKGIENRKMTRRDSIMHYMNFLHAGFLAMNPGNGEIKAWVGGINFQYFMYDHVLSRRQAGSVFKPILYATALENGFSPCEFISNDSVVFEEYENWKPRNADGKYGGYYSLKGALTNSINTVAARLILETGIDKVVNTARNLGIKADLAHVPSLALGSAEISLFEMIRAYSAFLNDGRNVQPKYILRIEDEKGSLIYQDNSIDYGQSAISPETSEEMLQMLRNVVDQGTGAGMRSRFGLYNDMGGKTGTTQNQSDGWFIALTPDLIAGAWVGGEIPAVRFRDLNMGEGSITAMPIVGNFFKSVYQNAEFQNMYDHRFEFSHIENMNEIFDCPDYKEKERRRKIFRIFDIFRRKDRRD